MIKKVFNFTLMLLVATYTAFSCFILTKTSILLLNTPSDKNVFLGIVLIILTLILTVLGGIVLYLGIKKLKKD
jgi:hypothetical protein